MKNTITTLIFTLLYLQSFSQTTVIEKAFKKVITHDCENDTYDLKAPLFHTKSANDVRQIVNDSIMDITGNYFEQYDSLPVNDDDSCESIVNYDYEMNYTIFQNNKNLLSILVYKITSSAVGSGFSDKEMFCFNINLKTNELIDLDSLFNQSNKEKVLKLFQAEYNKDANTPYEEDTLSIAFLGINISDTSLIGYYSDTWYPGRTAIFDLKIPLANVKQYLNKQYTSIVKPSEPKEK